MLCFFIFITTTQRIRYIARYNLFLNQKSILAPMPKYNIEDNSVVLVDNSFISRYLINQNPNAEFVTISADFSDYTQHIITNAKKNNKKFYLFTQTENIILIIKNENMKIKNCTKLDFDINDYDNQNVLCELIIN